jgi:hypothetical protein
MSKCSALATKTDVVKLQGDLADKPDKFDIKKISEAAILPLLGAYVTKDFWSGESSKIAKALDNSLDAQNKAAQAESAWRQGQVQIQDAKNTANNATRKALEAEGRAILETKNVQNNLGNQIIANNRANAALAQEAKSVAYDASRKALIAEGRAISEAQNVQKNLGNQILNNYRANQAATQQAVNTAASASRQALIAEGKAIASNQAAKKASFDALYAESKAASAARLASGAGSQALKALNLVGGVFSIIGTLATGVALAALTIKVAEALRIANDGREIAKKAEQLAKQNAQELIYARQASDRQDRDIARINTAIAKQGALIRKTQNAVIAVKEANVNLNNKLTIANNKINKVVDELNLTKGTANEALTKANLALNKLPPVPKVNDYSADISRLESETATLRRKYELQASDLAGFRVALETNLQRVEQKEDKYIVKRVAEATITNASGIRDLNGQIIGLPERTQANTDSIDKITKYVEGSDKQTREAIAKSGVGIETVKQVVKTEVDSKFKEFEQVNNQQATEINSKLDGLTSKLPEVLTGAAIATIVLKSPDFQKVLSNSGKKLTCQAPALVPPVGAQAKANGVAIGTLQGVTVAQNIITHGILKNPKFGLEKIQGFADTAWKATHADKVLQVVNTTLLIHNAMMLSNNLFQTMGEATSMALQAVQPSNHKGEPIDVNSLVKNKINSVLSSVLGAENYKALTARIAKANRIYQSGINILDATRNMFDATHSIAEVTLKHTGEIGNALRSAGVVYEDAYNNMVEKVNPASKRLMGLQKFRDEIEVVEEAFDSVSQVSSNVLEIRENVKEIKDGKAAMVKEMDDDIKAKKDTGTDTKAASQVTANPVKADFEAASPSE